MGSVSSLEFNSLFPCSLSGTKKRAGAILFIPAFEFSQGDFSIFIKLEARLRLGCCANHNGLLLYASRGHEMSDIAFACVIMLCSKV
jgi:hypothetical protein